MRCVTSYVDRVLLELIALGCDPERDSEWVRQDRARYFANPDPSFERARVAQLQALARGARSAA
jgi:hypothetical protein